ncbi:MAG TPA: right-handed parallel beta-helix repeat-containing protein, partial [Tepidisphaeraceae bacterium]|nr:right-handed parallel beta-helix repeat-containing protein [Tepidisphaeraceae bacterium]
VIIDNHTGRAGQQGKEGSRSSNGGGIAVSYNCAPQISGNLIAMNSVADNSDGGGIYLEYDAHALIRGNWIVGNLAADDGGGMYVMKNSQPRLERNVFAGNRNSSGGSGAIRLSKEGRLHAVNNLIVCNKTGIDAVHSWMILERNSFVDCMTCAFVYENALQHMAPPIITDNIFAGQMSVPAVIKPGPVSPRLQGNVVAGQTGSQPEVGSFAADLQFIDDQVIARVVRRDVDQANGLTLLTLSDIDADFQDGSLVGRVINLGQQWSVIRQHQRSTRAAGTLHELSVWGSLTDPASECRVLGTYRLAPSSAYRDKGAYAISD